MIIEPYEQFRFFVSSEDSPKNRHLVDLTWYKGNGCCDCFDFIAKHKPRLEAVPYPKPDYSNLTYRCKHIIAVHAVIGAKLIYDAVQQNKAILTAGHQVS